MCSCLSTYFLMWTSFRIHLKQNIRRWKSTSIWKLLLSFVWLPDDRCLLNIIITAVYLDWKHGSLERTWAEVCWGCCRWGCRWFDPPVDCAVGRCRIHQDTDTTSSHLACHPPWSPATRQVVLSAEQTIYWNNMAQLSYWLSSLLLLSSFFIFFYSFHDWMYIWLFVTQSVCQCVRISVGIEHR